VRVLVTGVAGYLGTVLAGRLLDAGYSVVGVDSLRYGNGPALGGLFRRGFEFHSLDVRDHAAVEKLAASCDCIVPLAALVGAPLCEKHREEAAAVNRDAVVALVGSLSPYQRVVHCSTNSGYGRCDMADETTPLNPVSHYGVTKAEGEKAVLDRPNSISLRLATVYGASPRMRFDLLVNDWTNQVRELRDHYQGPFGKSSLEIFEPTAKRNSVHVRTVADAILRALSPFHPVPDGVYNIADPNGNMTKLEIGQLICRTLGVPDLTTTRGGEDVDKRDCFVSVQKAVDAGFSLRQYGRSPADGILEVADLVRSYTHDQIRAARNA